MNPFDYGDPYIEMNEAISAIDEGETVDSIDALKDEVIKFLITVHNFLDDEASEKVEESVSDEPGMWSVNAEAEEIAKYLASDGDDD